MVILVECLPDEGIQVQRSQRRGRRVLDFAVANNLVIGNTFFAKRESHLVTYQSGTAKSQIDFIMLRKHGLKLAKNIKIIPSEECVPQQTPSL